MRIADGWKDYRILDTSSGEKLEMWGDVCLARPDPQIIWNTPKGKIWKKADAHYQRSNTGGGQWEFYHKLPEHWAVSYKELRFQIKPTGFKHTGLFPEQAVNWDLFDRLIRWIVDDCEKFVSREIKRGKTYDAIIMDPPSYGRGPSGEVWQLEERIYDLVQLCTGVLSDDPLFFALNSYTTGLSPSVMSYLLGVTVGKKFGGRVSADEIGLPVAQSGYNLPCGSTAIWQK